MNTMGFFMAISLSPLLLLAALSPRNAALPDLAAIFLTGDREGFEALLSPEMRVRLDLRPLLFDHGHLSGQQAQMGFGKLLRRYEVLDARIANSQSDANYAWLEIYLELDLRDKVSSQRCRASFSFAFKIVDSRLAVSRWTLQDVL